MTRSRGSRAILSRAGKRTFDTHKRAAGSIRCRSCQGEIATDFLAVGPTCKLLSLDSHLYGVGAG